MTGALLSYAINALWQIPLVFGFAWLAARLLRPAGPRAEYGVWLIALLLEAILPACPAGLLRGLLRSGPKAPDPSAALVSVRQGPVLLHAGLHLSPMLSSFLVLLYGIAVLLITARLCRGVLGLLRLVRQAEPVALSEDFAAVWEACGLISTCRPRCFWCPKSLGVLSRLACVCRAFCFLPGCCRR